MANTGCEDESGQYALIVCLTEEESTDGECSGRTTSANRRVAGVLAACRLVWRPLAALLRANPLPNGRAMGHR